MRKVMLLVIFLVVSNFAYAETPSEKLALLDNYKYQSQHYQLIIDKLQEYTTTTNEELIAAIISKVQSKLEKEFPGITIYEVALGIKKTTETFYDKDGGKKQDLSNMAAFYLTAKQLENRGL